MIHFMTTYQKKSVRFSLPGSLIFRQNIYLNTNKPAFKKNITLHSKQYNDILIKSLLTSLLTTKADFLITEKLLVKNIYITKLLLSLIFFLVSGL